MINIHKKAIDIDTFFRNFGKEYNCKVLLEQETLYQDNLIKVILIK